MLGVYKPGTWMQELLHNFGMHHSFRGGSEYMDFSTFMGSAYSACPTAPELLRLGNLYLSLRVRRGGDSALDAEYVYRLSVHEALAAVDNALPNPQEDPRFDLVNLMDQGESLDLPSYGLRIQARELVGGGQRMVVDICRYRFNASLECRMPPIPTVCPIVDGYLAQRDLDSLELGPNNLGVERADRPDALASFCDNEPRGCAGFSWDARLQVGYWKGAVQPLRSAVGSCLYTRVVPAPPPAPTPPPAAVCPTVNGYRAFEHVARTGDDLALQGATVFIDLAALASACRASPACGSFGWDPRARQGTGHANTTATATATGKCHYVKEYLPPRPPRPPAQPPLPPRPRPPSSRCVGVAGYAVFPDTDHDGDDIGIKASVAEAATACNADSRCKGFNSGGRYKTEVSPIIEYQGSCLYVKVLNLSTACPRPSDWCTSYGASLASADCDGDKLEDWICTDPAGNRGTVRSSDSCLSRWPNADPGLCPAGQLDRLPGSDLACVEGYDVRGNDIVTWSSVSSRVACRELCRRDRRCQFFVIRTDGRCVLRNYYLAGAAGTNGPSSVVEASCLSGSTNYGSFECVPGWDVNGDHAAAPFYVSHVYDCRTRCRDDEYCLFFLYLPATTAGSTGGTCALKYNAFRGQYGTTQPNAAIQWACFYVRFAEAGGQ
ncbi:hypothetical protein HYH03_005108 [Edaphochlamys debaryana]|uniref:Apple domain-containing protein n=1 Tax=Edaphochlamys debaryana TaxID=47281 RepID=A0A836C1F2_9CHLO|nr:hypothetical protein HYH03_005108 [Edaphochlamys debaryana]|eukprot:KAG2496690.1 hypothetical protein HYH03_005108 [Edaphochlamys debaryana]